MLDQEILILNSRSQPPPAPAAVPGTDLPVNSADLKALGHQVLLCFPRRFGRGAEPSEQPQSCSPACPALTARLCHSQEEESTGARAHSHRQQNKDSFFGLRAGEMQSAPLPAKTPQGKVSSLWCELTHLPTLWLHPGEIQDKPRHCSKAW